MREVSETVVVYTCLINRAYISGTNFWHKSLGRVTSKVENLVFYKHETGVLFVEGFAEKFFFAFQAQSCPRLFRTLPLTLLPQTAAYKYFHFFWKSRLQSLCVCNCRGIGFFNQPHCLSKVCVPAKEEIFFVGFLPKCFTNSPRLWATFCNFRRFSGTCCLEAPLI